LSLKPAQHLSEDLRRQLGRSTRARNHLSQTHLESSFLTGTHASGVHYHKTQWQRAGGVRTGSFSAAATFAKIDREIDEFFLSIEPSHDICERDRVDFSHAAEILQALVQ